MFFAFIFKNMHFISKLIMRRVVPHEILRQNIWCKIILGIFDYAKNSQKSQYCQKCFQNRKFSKKIPTSINKPILKQNIYYSAKYKIKS